MSDTLEPQPVTNKKDEALATILLDRKERSERAMREIEAICQRERVQFAVNNLQLRQGMIIPSIELVALD